MKITTWNVNGYRAMLSKNGLDWIDQEEPDVLCLQEIKVKPEQLSEELREREGYLSVWNAAERPGYSGTAIFYKPETQPLEISTGLGFPEFDNEGRVVRLKYPDFYLYNIYFPNGGRTLERVPYKLDFYARLLEICNELHQKGENVILTGDFNTAHTEIDLARPKSNVTSTGFLPEERVWIDKYLANGFVDVYRHLYPEKIEYTWWSYMFNARKNNVGWRLDYFLISEALVPRIAEVAHHCDIMGSDHCPVTLVINP